MPPSPCLTRHLPRRRQPNAFVFLSLEGDGIANFGLLRETATWSDPCILLRSSRSKTTPLVTATTSSGPSRLADHATELRTARSIAAPPASSGLTRYDESPSRRSCCRSRKARSRIATIGSPVLCSFGSIQETYKVSSLAGFLLATQSTYLSPTTPPKSATRRCLCAHWLGGTFRSRRGSNV